MLRENLCGKGKIVCAVKMVEVSTVCQCQCQSLQVRFKLQTCVCFPALALTHLRFFHRPGHTGFGEEETVVLYFYVSRPKRSLFLSLRVKWVAGEEVTFNLLAIARVTCTGPSQTQSPHLLASSFSSSLPPPPSASSARARTVCTCVCVSVYFPHEKQTGAQFHRIKVSSSLYDLARVFHPSLRRVVSCLTCGPSPLEEKKSRKEKRSGQFIPLNAQRVFECEKKVVTFRLEEQ